MNWPGQISHYHEDDYDDNNLYDDNSQYTDDKFDSYHHDGVMNWPGHSIMMMTMTNRLMVMLRIKNMVIWTINNEYCDKEQDDYDDDTSEWVDEALKDALLRNDPVCQL